MNGLLKVYQHQEEPPGEKEPPGEYVIAAYGRFVLIGLLTYCGRLILPEPAELADILAEDKYVFCENPTRCKEYTICKRLPEEMFDFIVPYYHPCPTYRQMVGNFTWFMFYIQDNLSMQETALRAAVIAGHVFSAVASAYSTRLEHLKKFIVSYVAAMEECICGPLEKWQSEYYARLKQMILEHTPSGTNDGWGTSCSVNRGDWTPRSFARYVELEMEVCQQLSERTTQMIGFVKTIKDISDNLLAAANESECEHLDKLVNISKRICQMADPVANYDSVKSDVDEYTQLKTVLSRSARANLSIIANELLYSDPSLRLAAFDDLRRSKYDLSLLAKIIASAKPDLVCDFYSKCSLSVDFAVSFLLRWSSHLWACRIVDGGIMLIASAGGNGYIGLPRPAKCDTDDFDDCALQESTWTKHTEPPPLVKEIGLGLDDRLWFGYENLRNSIDLANLYEPIFTALANTHLPVVQEEIQRATA